MQRLQSGDVLIQLDEMTGKQFTSSLHDKDLKLKKKLVGLAMHGLIYNEKMGSDNNLLGKAVHSASGKTQLGVTQQRLEKALPEMVLGEVLVLRPKQKDIQKNLGAVAERWAPVLSRDDTAKRKKNSDGKSLLPTPLGYRTEEVTEDESQNVGHTVYRALRAYQRNHSKYTETTTGSDGMSEQHTFDATPLSKNKGVSCSDFVSYSYKVALLESIFPKGIPEKVQEIMMEIEAAKKDQHVSKLESLAEQELFTRLDAELKKHLTDDQYEVILTPVKGMGIRFFTAVAFEREDKWEVAGYLCYLEKDNKERVPYIVSEDIFKKLGLGKDGSAHPMIVTEKELEKIGVKEVFESKEGKESTVVKPI